MRGVRKPGHDHDDVVRPRAVPDARPDPGRVLRPPRSSRAGSLSVDLGLRDRVVLHHRCRWRCRTDRRASVRRRGRLRRAPSSRSGRGKCGPGAGDRRRDRGRRRSGDGRRRRSHLERTGRRDGRARRRGARTRRRSSSRRPRPTRAEQFAEISDESWDSVVDDVLGATFRTCRAVVPGMQEAGWGRIVNIAARSGLRRRGALDALRGGQGRGHRPDRVAGQGARPAAASSSTPWRRPRS